jgi:hypothetical protein
MPNYISMAVREDLVDDVTKFIAERLSMSGKTGSSVLARHSDDSPFETEESREWSLEELQLIRDNSGGAKSIKLFAEVLDVIAAEHPNPVSKEAIAEVTGVEPLRMQNAFGRATVWIRNRTHDKRWPIYWVNQDWAMSDNNAELWKSIS